VTLDREKGKLWVTLTATNEIVQLTGDSQPREQRRYPAVRQPNSVAVHEPTGRVFVTGAADGVLQVLDGYAQTP
jgi:DNA-binding beta-propeller fold protein YncE